MVTLKKVDLKYVDPSVSLTEENGTCKILNNFKDIKVNNYSAIFLSGDRQVSDFVTIDTKEAEINKIITPVYFDQDGKRAYLHFNSRRLIDNGADGKFIFAELVPVTDLDNYNITEDTIYQDKNFIFEITINDVWLSISVQHNRETYYMVPGDEGADNYYSLLFANNIGRFEFGYTREGNRFIIFDSYVSEVFSIAPYSKAYVEYTSSITGNKERYNTGICMVRNRGLINPVVIAGETCDCTSTIKISRQINDPETFINPAWLSFNDKNSVSVNPDKSSFNMSGQSLIHLEYNRIKKDGDTWTVPVNFIQLKNHISSTNNAIRGEYMSSSYTGTGYNTPNVSYRRYMSLETGPTQEKGSPNITLTYTFYDTEYEVRPGEDFIFEIKNNDSSPLLDDVRKCRLFPANRLNIRHTNFIKNGAFGSDIPYFADKVKKFQENSEIINNGHYLYTWLLRDKTNPYGIWLDRYYFPDKLSEQNTDYLSGFGANIITDFYGGKAGLDIEGTYFDKVSDLCFETSDTKTTKYMYSRIGKNDITKVLDTLTDIKINSADKFTSGDKSIIIDNTGSKSTGQFDLFFDMYLAKDRIFGPCIMGSSYTSGFSIKNRSDYTPFIYTFANKVNSDGPLVDGGAPIASSVVTLSNYSCEKIKDIDICSLYGDKSGISKIVIGEPGTDIAIITGQAIYIAGFDLFIKKVIKRAGTQLDAAINDCSIFSKKLYMLFENNSVYCIDFVTEEIVEINNAIKVRLTNANTALTPQFKTIIVTGPDSVFITEYYKYCMISPTEIYGIGKQGENFYTFEYANLQIIESGITDTAAYHNIIFGSYDELYDIATDSNNRFAIIKYDNNEKITNIHVFDRSRKELVKYKLGAYNAIYALDAFKTYRAGKIDTFFGFIGNTKDNTGITRHFVTINERNIITDTIIDIDIDESIDTLCNFNEARRLENKNELVFSLGIPDKGMIVDEFTYTIPLKSILNGWYTFRVSINLNTNTFDVLMNGNKLTPDRDIDLNKYTYNTANIFNYPITVGTMIYKNGIPFAQFSNVAETYYDTINVRIRDIKAFSEQLHDYEANAVFMDSYELKPLVITLPAGMRNNVEEIVRYFKFNQPASMSNKVDINIGGIDGLLSNSGKDQLVKDLYESLKGVLPVTVDINNINFI